MKLLVVNLKISCYFEKVNKYVFYFWGLKSAYNTLHDLSLRKSNSLCHP